MTLDEARELAGRLQGIAGWTESYIGGQCQDAKYMKQAADALIEMAGEVERRWEAMSKGHDDGRVLFYEREFYVLSNFSAFRLNWGGLDFDTSEAAYHWEKFPSQPALQRLIHEAPSAHAAFKSAELNRVCRRADWDDVKLGIMKRILRAKADQHEYVRRKLLETGDRELIEDSWRDDYWGWGPNGDGQNMLGRLWMEVRSDLRAAALTPQEDGQHD